jgi:predicted O-linked N-acetylglucosamine transferase (SPINDLY family)
VLKEIPTARLNILIAGGSKGNQHVVDAFTSHGVDASRIGLMPMGDGEHYFRLFQQLDIALDPFPFSGHTTTCDALSMGVPLVTLAGQTYAGRMATSTLTAVGQTDWIAQSEGEYVQIAAKLANDLPRLAELRESLPGALAKSPAMDAASFTRELEAAYREMWRTRVRR